ncbi:phosphoesterase [Tamlana sedimentorum]|uniref:Phosphoesterase n=1 Tax=Neotamlana sedimentorum TaxID=1435349 RepID=A0A0D7W8M4_9FLAO|nr:metallophosphoesterase [Tamlana sedimentorum]KJD35404.1 phosphoesterase [Tamlana sedimentorum]
MKQFLLLFGLVISFFACKKEVKQAKQQSASSFKIGIVADCQYCFCEPNTDFGRYYKKSTQKLAKAVSELNTYNLDYTVHLGDFIDKNFASFDSVLPIWNNLKSEHHHVLGNHDFSVADSLKGNVANKMGLQNRYYSIINNNWRFIVLDGNDLSFFGALTEAKKAETDSMYNQLKSEGYKNIQKWNGGLSFEQLKWVKSELEQSVKNNENVGFYCHFPVAENDTMHSLWNYNQFFKTIDNYNNVKFYFNGHNHAGGYFKRKGVHYVTYKGMVDFADSTAYSVATVFKDSILIKGFGRENSRNLKF